MGMLYYLRFVYICLYLYLVFWRTFFFFHFLLLHEFMGTPELFLFWKKNKVFS